MAAEKAVVVTLQQATPFLLNSMLAPRQVLAALKLRAGQSFNLQFGQRAIEVRILVREETPNGENSTVLLLSPDAVRALSVPLGKSFHMCKDGQNVRLGPVVGILANVRVKNNVPAGLQEPVFTKLLATAEQEQVFSYVFSPRDVNYSDGTVRGYIWSEKKGWESVQCPLPDVVYDQIISRKFAESETTNRFRENFIQKTNVPYFNPTFFDKWQVHGWLATDSAARQFLPETIRYESPATTAGFISNHRVVYIKPVNGSLGIGIIRIERLPGGKFQYQIKARDKVAKEGTEKTAADTVSALSKRLIRDSYIVQNGLNLLTYQGRPFDIRILSQKDRLGKWRRTKSFCRIAKEGDITSNLSTGGDALPVQKVLQEAVRDKAQIKKIQANLTKLIRTVPGAIEQNSGLLLGELGLDVGVDVAGHVWLIEANSRPWKKPTTEQGSMVLVNQSFARPIQFAKYLAGF